MIKKILIYALCAAIIAVVVLSYSLRKAAQEKERYKANQTALLKDVEHYKTESGKNAASVLKLTLTKDELKHSYDSIVKVAKDLKIDLKRAQSVAQTSTMTKTEVKTEVRESLVYVKGEPISIECFDWRDPWTDVSGILAQDSVTLQIQSRDTITQIVHRVPHKWWFFKWGTKAIRQDVVSSNPHTTITFTEYIEIK